LGIGSTRRIEVDSQMSQRLVLDAELSNLSCTMQGIAGTPSPNTERRWLNA
jgi:hypothetical protein